jgi:hypothetical protein
MDSLSEETRWASGMAARLRVLQANGSEAAPGQQQEFMAEELERGLKEVVPSKRRAFLQALADRFPVWQMAALTAQGPAVTPDIVEDTPERRLEALLQIAGKLSSEERTEFSARLMSAGFAIGHSSGALQSTPELQKALGATDGELNGDRAVKLLAITAGLGLMIDQVVWNVWKQLAPKTNVARTASDVRALMRRYLAGDSEVSSQQISQALEQSRRLTASLLMSVGGAGRTFAKKQQERFSPQEITELAKMEKKAWEALDKRCWEKYVELFREFGDEAAIDGEIQQSIAKYAEQVMQGAKAV